MEETLRLLYEPPVADITFLRAMKGDNAMYHFDHGGNIGTCGMVTVAPELFDSGERSPEYRIIHP